MERKKIIVAITGASGAELGLYVLKALQLQDVEIHLILSEGAKRVIQAETIFTPEDFLALSDFHYPDTDLGARIASGSYKTDGMIVVPCSMKTLSGIANAYDENLIIRAADVCIKENRRVVLVPREMPLNRAHLRNMLTVAEDGGVILPPPEGLPFALQAFAPAGSRRPGAPDAGRALVCQTPGSRKKAHW